MLPIGHQGYRARSNWGRLRSAMISRGMTRPGWRQRAQRAQRARQFFIAVNRRVRRRNNPAPRGSFRYVIKRELGGPRKFRR